MNSAGRVEPGRDWMVCGASVVGSEHRRRGLGCDDAYSYGVLGDFLVAAVADGAGSVTGTSAWGAYVACRGVLKDGLNPEFVDRFRAASAAEATQLLRSLFEGALERVYRQAASMNLDAALLSTTLCVALADPRMAAFGQVGDGIIATECGEAIETVLIEHKDGYANTTSFLQSAGALDDSLRTVSHSGVSAFALSTDGLTYKITDVATGAAYQPFFRGSWQHVRAGAQSGQLQEMLGGIEDDQTGDDKTLVLAALGDGVHAAAPGTMRWAHSGAPGSPVETGESGAGDGAHAAAQTQPAASGRRSRWERWLR